MKQHHRQSSMPAGVEEGDGGDLLNSSVMRESASEELEEGLRAPLLAGHERGDEGLLGDEAPAQQSNNGSSATEPCSFSDLFFLADVVRVA